MNVFQWRKRGRERPTATGLRIATEAEELTGEVQGRSATDIEERMYYAFINNKVDKNDIQFQPTAIGNRWLPGEIRPDFALYNPLLSFWFADGEYYHKTQAQKNNDKFQDARIQQEINDLSEPPIRIPGEDLMTQDDADREVGERLG